jgi:glyoxylase-like metal-dependent hydrolase (beta-lactamase superfamily II)
MPVACVKCWLATLLVAGATTAAASSLPVTRPVALATDLWLVPGGFLPNRQPDGNSVVFRGKEGLVVFDTGRHRWHRAAILELAEREGAAVVAIVNSHWHLDHVSGNPDLKAAFPGAKVHASDAIDGALAGFFRDSAASAREYLKSSGVPAETAEDIRADLDTIDKGAALRPDVVIRKSELQPLAGRMLELNLAPHGPTAGDVWLYDPQERVVAAGDLVTLPVPFLDTACVAGWRAALSRIAERPFRLLVPGHGKPMSAAEFSVYRLAFENFANCAASDDAAATCATRWANDAATLLEANAMDRKRAEGMAAYYVKAVLRPHGGNSKYCRPGVA